MVLKKIKSDLSIWSCILCTFPLSKFEIHFSWIILCLYSNLSGPSGQDWLISSRTVSRLLSLPPAVSGKVEPCASRPTLGSSVRNHLGRPWKNGRLMKRQNAQIDTSLRSLYLNNITFLMTSTSASWWSEFAHWNKNWKRERLVSGVWVQLHVVGLL